MCGKEIDFPFNPQNAGVTASPQLGADGEETLSGSARRCSAGRERKARLQRCRLRKWSEK